MRSFVTGSGAPVCLPAVVGKVNEELRAHASRCGVEFSSAPAEGQPDRMEVAARCEFGKK